MINTPMNLLDVDELKNRLAKEKFLKIPNIEFDKDHMAQLAKSLGSGNTWNNPPIYGRPISGNNFNVVEIKATSDKKTVGVGQFWHADGTYMADIPIGNILHITKAPSKGGYTQFVSTTDVLERMPGSLYDEIKDLKAVHSHGKIWKAGRRMDRYPDKILPDVVHPVINTHPQTKESVLFVNKMITSEIQGVSKIESARLLKEIYSYLYDPNHVTFLRADDNSVIIWDNFCSQHRAINDYYPETRTGYRISYF